MIKLTIFCVIISIIISFVLSIPYECKDLSNTNCTACLNIKGCSYCKKTEQCFPSSLSAPCPTADLQFQTCFADAQTLAIALGSAGGVLLIIIIIVICCCCRKCRQRTLQQLKKREHINERQLEERRAAAEIRSADRNQKADQIRMKYGIVKGGDTRVEYKQMNNKT